MQHLYPKLQSHGIPMMKTHYHRHTNGSLGRDVPLEDSKWRVLHDGLLSNLERMPGCWRLIWNFVIGKVCDFDFDVDRWSNYVEMREEEFEEAERRIFANAKSPDPSLRIHNKPEN